MAAGLVKAEGFAVDASIIAADANKQRSVPGTDPVDWSSPALSTRAVREYLEGLDGEALAEAMPKRLSLTDPQSSRSEEHTSELQSLMRISYAVFCLKKKNNKQHKQRH